MRLPIQTAGQRNDIEGRPPVRRRQVSFRPPSCSARGPWGTWPRTHGAYQPKRPARAGLASSIRASRALSQPYFAAAGFLNRSSASVGFNSILVSFASITGLSSISVFSLCGYWTPPTGFQSP